MKKHKKNYKIMYKSQKAMKEHYKELFDTSVGKLRFNNIQIKTHQNNLEEIKILLEKGANNKLIKKVIENTEQRLALDNLIYEDLIFKKQPGD